jgi:hypothetical protein
MIIKFHNKYVNPETIDPNQMVDVFKYWNQQAIKSVHYWEYVTLSSLQCITHLLTDIEK